MSSRHFPRLARAGFTGAAYLLGAASGIALALPLAATAFTPERMPAPRAIEAPAVTQALLVNRAAKGPRLEIHTPAPTVSAPVLPDLARDAPAPAPRPVSEEKAAPAAKPASPTPAGATPSLPRGCLSALGGLRPNIPTENLTVCIADISTID